MTTVALAAVTFVGGVALGWAFPQPAWVKTVWGKLTDW